ncbi:hypothetical protein PAERUG_E5_London_17_VIM_2_12_12_02914 [Pseudomonas aeruginosa]|nr:hypothetical protein PAERUG_E5_London_17_VIM_2_12_12_02914 [Pseudomonas aeruginosa]
MLVVAGQAQAPLLVEVMAQGGLEGFVVVVDLAVVRFAEEPRARQAAQVVVRRHGAAVEDLAVAHHLGFHQQRGVRVQLPAERWRHQQALAVGVVAEALAVLHRQVHPVEQVALFVQRRVQVQGRAVAVPTAGAGMQAGEALGLGLLGHQVHRAAGIAAPVKAGGRSLEDFHALDGGAVRGVHIAAVGAEAVAVELRSGEATDVVLEHRQAAEVVLPRDPAGEVQRPFDTSAVKVVEHLARHHADGLRDVLDTGVGARRAGRPIGPVALHRARRALRFGGDSEDLKLRGTFRFRPERRTAATEADTEDKRHTDSHGKSHQKRNDIL